MSRRDNFRVLFWTAIAAFLLLNVGQILPWPTEPTANSRSPLVISEFLAANATGMPDEDGDPSDWVEIHNRSARAVNLAGWWLTDDPARPEKWALPDYTLAAGDYLLVFASGKDRRTIELSPEARQAQPASQPFFLHTNFRLDAAGGFLALYGPTSRRYLDASAIHYPDQFPDTSYGLGTTDSAYRFFPHPTPGSANDERGAWLGIAEPVTFSVAHGFFDAPFSVALDTSTPGATIRFTTDGSEPSETAGEIYAEPLPISRTTILRAAAFKPGYLASPSATQTYIFLDDVLAQPPDPAGFPATWGTHRIDFAGHKAGDPVIADYEMDPEVVHDPRYSDLVRQGLLSLPSVSIVTDMDNLDIYFADPQMRGIQSERPASIELIYPDRGQPGFQVNAGLRIQGGAGRWEFMPKHSFRLFFKAAYGPTKLKYKLFADSPMDEFDTLILRAGSDRSYAGYPAEMGDHGLVTYTRDEWLRASQLAISGMGAHGRFVHLYLNGLYWGLYNLVERPDASFAASYLGGDKEDWYSASQGGSISGMIDRFDVLRRLAAEGNLADPDRYATMLEFIDPIQFADYMVLNWYAGNTDWPENNWYVNVKYPAGRNLFFCWDGEGTWVHGVELRLGVDDVGDTYFPNIIKPIFLALMENADFRMVLADRLYKQLFNDGPLTETNSKARWMAIADQVETAIVAESARWGDARHKPAITQADWFKARDWVMVQMEGNEARLIQLAREAGYYPPIDPPAFDPHGTTFEDAMTVSLHAASGTIFYTTDGADPRQQVTGAPSPDAKAYTAPIVLTRSTRIKARALAGDTWSALAEADFIREGEPAGVRISELMYNPPGGNAYEFVELHNVGSIAVDLSSAYFEGIDFRFERNTTLPGRGYMVLARDFHAYRERYPEAPIHGLYGGQLADRGETIRLRDAQGNVLFSVRYDDENGWPLSADGSGDSIELIDPTGDPNDPRHWRASGDVYGSPGEAPTGESRKASDHAHQG